jgi:hypothetical protein
MKQKLIVKGVWNRRGVGEQGAADMGVAGDVGD